MLTDHQFFKSVCIGDGCLSLKKRKRKTDGFVSSWVYFQVSHCLRQTPWLIYKADRFASYLGRSAVIYGPYKHKLPDGNYTLQYRYSVSAERQLRPVYESLYKGQEKKINSDFLSDLDCEALSILWQDDGGVYEDSGHLHGVLSLNYADIQDVFIVIDWIYSITKAKGTVRKDHNGNFSIRFSYEELKKLVPCIEQYILPELAYKICLSASNRRLASLPKLVLGDDKVARVPDDLKKYFEADDIVRSVSMAKIQN